MKLPKIHSKDLIAITIIFTFLILKIRGMNGTLDGAIGLILGYYFVKRTNGQDNGQ